MATEQSKPWSVLVRRTGPQVDNALADSLNSGAISRVHFRYDNSGDVELFGYGTASLSALQTRLGACNTTASPFESSDHSNGMHPLLQAVNRALGK